jgi:branched-subunit amino acid transport protein
VSFIHLFGRFDVPETLRRALHYVPPAVLSAIVFPELLLHGGRLDLTAGNDRLLAGRAAVLIAWLTKNILLTILAGMGVLLLLQFLV